LRLRPLSIAFTRLKESKTKMNNDLQCKCHSGKEYKICCQPFHQGKLPETSLELMRSRYCAYANLITQYIIETTHPESPYFKENKTKWTEDIATFSRNTTFEGLDIIDFVDGERESFVTFYAKLSRQGKDTSFKEKSRFEKINDKWFYIARV